MSQREVPLGINTALGAVAVTVLCLMPASLDQQGRDARFAVLAVGVFAFAATVVDPLAVAVTAGVAFLLFDGFVEGRQGDLVWNGRSDLLRLALLYGVGTLGLILGAVHGWRERHRRSSLRSTPGHARARSRYSPPKPHRPASLRSGRSMNPCATSAEEGS